jgi:hypothetical protein
MESIGKVLRERPGSIVLFGHTDGRAYRSQTPDNWRLSWARAQMAYYMLTRAGVPEARLGRVVLCKSIPQRSRASARRGKSPHRNSFEHPKTLRIARSRSAPDAAMKPSPKPSSQRSRTKGSDDRAGSRATKGGDRRWLDIKILFRKLPCDRTKHEL